LPSRSVKVAFKKFDINNDGHLDRNEFKQLVASCNGGSDQAADALFKQGDTDGDGKLDYQELIKLLYPASAQALPAMVALTKLLMLSSSRATPMVTASWTTRNSSSFSTLLPHRHSRSCTKTSAT